MFEVSFGTAGAAFDELEGDAGVEVARILRVLADRVEGGLPAGDGASVRDVNGNTVGVWAYTSEV